MIDLTAESSRGDSVTAGPSFELVEARRVAPPQSYQKTGLSQTNIPPPPETHAHVMSEAASSAPPETSTSEISIQAGPLTSSYVRDDVATEPSSNDQGRSESTRSSGRSKKPTRFFGDPLRHSVKVVEESDNHEPTPPAKYSEQNPPTPFVPISRAGCPSPFHRTKDQVTPFKKTRLAEQEN